MKFDPASIQHTRDFKLKFDELVNEQSGNGGKHLRAKDGKQNTVNIYTTSRISMHGLLEKFEVLKSVAKRKSDHHEKALEMVRAMVKSAYPSIDNEQLEIIINKFRDVDGKGIKVNRLRDLKSELDGIEKLQNEKAQAVRQLSSQEKTLLEIHGDQMNLENPKEMTEELKKKAAALNDNKEGKQSAYSLLGTIERTIKDMSGKGVGPGTDDKYGTFIPALGGDIQGLKDNIKYITQSFYYDKQNRDQIGLQVAMAILEKIRASKEVSEDDLYILQSLKDGEPRFTSRLIGPLAASTFHELVQKIGQKFNIENSEIAKTPGRILVDQLRSVIDSKDTLSVGDVSDILFQDFDLGYGTEFIKTGVMSTEGAKDLYEALTLLLNSQKNSMQVVTDRNVHPRYFTSALGGCHAMLAQFGNHNFMEEVYQFLPDGAGFHSWAASYMRIDNPRGRERIEVFERTLRKHPESALRAAMACGLGADAIEEFLNRDKMEDRRKTPHLFQKSLSDMPIRIDHETGKSEYATYDANAYPIPHFTGKLIYQILNEKFQKETEGHFETLKARCSKDLASMMDTGSYNPTGNPWPDLIRSCRDAARLAEYKALGY